MYVPDQEGDPKSILLSYAQGRMLFILLILLGIHVLLGMAGYFYAGTLRKERAVLTDTVAALEAENKQIERIVQEFQEIRARDQRIRQAFGSTLGVKPDTPEEWAKVLAEAEQAVQSFAEIREPASEPDIRPKRVRDGLYFLTQKETGYNGPEYLPTLLPVGGYLTTHFQKGGGYRGRDHFGIDIAAQKGAVIHAAGAGDVLFANWTPDFGNMIILGHGNGIYSYYGHAMRLLVEQGTHVRKGQAIALLGSSGISSAAHLHFEIWKDNQPHDPEDFLFAIRK